MRRVCLVGAGKVADMHAPALLDTPGTELVAVCDPNERRARQLADAYEIPHVFRSVNEALVSGSFEFAHVLVPPDLHVDVSLQLIEAGVGTLIEKPMGRSSAECQTVTEAGRARGVQVGVNHNSVFYSAYLELRRAVLGRSHGALQHLIVLVNRPRHWLLTKSPWVRERPEHIAYESAVHPLAQIYDLAGPARDVATLATGRHELGDGMHFMESWQASFLCERATAQLCLTYGEYSAYQVIALCTDGVLTAEVESNRLTAVDRTRWSRTRFGRILQPSRVARRAALAELTHGVQNLGRELLPARGRRTRANVYLASMHESIAAFHRGPSAEQPKVDAEFGAQVVGMCDVLTSAFDGARARGRHNGRPHRLKAPDAVVLGGTGLVGRALLTELTSAGMAVRVVGRATMAPSALLDRPDLQVLAADPTDGAILGEAIRGARAVVHVADEWDQISWRSVEGSVPRFAQELVRTCAEHGVERLLCLGSINSLYTGEPEATVVGSAEVDLQASASSASDFAQAVLEQAVSAAASRERLPLCLLRAGMVFGPGADPRHPGLGVWRGETHCVGFGEGTSPLPLVLASDVANAIRLALVDEQAVGKTFNLVGDVRLSARSVINGLRAALGRPFVFHPAHPAQHYALAISKHAARKVLRRPYSPRPSYRAYQSRACRSSFDCADVKRGLGWTPVAQPEVFIERAFTSESQPGLQTR